MAAQAETDRLQEGWELLLAGPLDCLPSSLAYRQHVVAIHPLGGHAISARLAVKLRFGRGALDGGAHAIVVVDDEEDDRQLPELSQVERLVEGADVGGRIAHLAEDNRVVAAV